MTPKLKQIALIALGSNLPRDDETPAGLLNSALDMLAAQPDIDIRSKSRWFQSPAFPRGSGPDFVNGAARLATDLGPEALLDRLHYIEARLGRERSTRWAARVCDLDLIAHDDTVLPDPTTQRAWMDLAPEAARTRAPDRLILPHPRMQERAFVLIPLAEIAPDWCHPALGQSIHALTQALPEAARAEISPL